jgi:L-alanine-DL-glutamate epimerase-like enolase superfamily enzyme
MKVTSFDTGIYSVPLTESWGSSTYSFTSLEFVVVWLRTDTGHTGTGWTFSVGNGGSAFKNLLDHYLAPKVVGHDPFQVERLWNAMWLESHDIGSAGTSTHAISAVDIALWDLIGQELGQPLYRLLGDCRDSLPGYGSGVNLHLSLDELLAQIESFLAQGYRSVKMKIGRDPQEDLDRVMAVRRLVGPSVGILVDANQKWFPPEVVRRIRLLEQADLFWLEEPTLSDDVDGHIRIRQRTPVPVAVGESLYTKYQFADWITRGACDYIQPNVHRVGGITEFMKIVKMAESHNVPVAPHFGMELVAHLGCAAPNVISFEGLRGAGLSEMGIVEEPVVVTDGRVRPSQRPGHGVRFKRDVLDRHALTEADLQAGRPTTRIDLH